MLPYFHRFSLLSPRACSVRTASRLINQNSNYDSFFCSSTCFQIYLVGKSQQILSSSHNPSTRSCTGLHESRPMIMYSIFFTFTVLIINISLIPLVATEQVDKRSSYDHGSRPSGLNPSAPYPRANQYSSSSNSNPSRRRNNRRDGKSCQQRPEIPNPLKGPYSLANPLDDGPDLPYFRIPFAESDEQYCPMFQYVVCDSGLDNDRILRVASGKWRLTNCNRCK